MGRQTVEQMPFSKIYPLLVNKAVRKGRAKGEVDEVIRWLTGYSQGEIDALAAGAGSYAAFFAGAPRMNPDRETISGTVCGVRVEAVEDPLLREIRRLDKLVDELAKGRPLDAVLRAQ